VAVVVSSCSARRETEKYAVCVWDSGRVVVCEVEIWETNGDNMTTGEDRIETVWPVVASGAMTEYFC